MMKKMLSVLLALTMVAGIGVCGAVQAGAAAPVGPSPIAVWDFKSVTADGGGTYGGGSWAWVQATKTLTLTDIDFSTSAIQALATPAGATIALIGQNIIECEYSGSLPCYGINAAGDLTIIGDGTLFVACDGTAIRSSGNLTVSNGAAVLLLGGDGSINMITGGNNLVISGGAEVNAVGGIQLSKNSDLIVNGGTLMSLRGTGAITRGMSRGYFVPSGATYWVNTDKATPDNAAGPLISDGKVNLFGSMGEKVKYFKVEANSAEPFAKAIGKNYSDTFWNRLLYYVLFGFVWMHL